MLNIAQGRNICKFDILHVTEIW